MIIVVGYVHLDPSDVGAFVADVQAVAPGTRAEPGCLFYAVTVDDAMAGRVLVAERWRDEASLSAHLGAQAASAFSSTWTGRIRLDVHTYDASNERPLVE